MNLPAGVPRVTGREPVSLDMRRELEELSGSSFSGYVAETLLHEDGVHEFALVFRVGKGIGALYAYYPGNKTLYGDAALPFVFNGFVSPKGMMDVVDLSLQQVDLVVAFNAKVKFSNPLDKNQLRNNVKKSFDTHLLSTIQEVKGEGGDTKESLFRRFGLLGIDH